MVWGVATAAAAALAVAVAVALVVVAALAMMTSCVHEEMACQMTITHWLVHARSLRPCPLRSLQWHVTGFLNTWIP